MALTFNTLAYANKLKTAGMEPKLVEAQAEIQAETFAELTQDQLATKFDIREVKAEMREVKAELRELEIKMNAKFNTLKNELIIKLGGTMVACTAILGTIIMILSHF